MGDNSIRQKEKKVEPVIQIVVVNMTEMSLREYSLVVGDVVGVNVGSYGRVDHYGRGCRDFAGQ